MAGNICPNKMTQRERVPTVTDIVERAQLYRLATSAKPAVSCRRVHITELRIEGSIGVYEHEKQALQPIVVTLALDISDHYDGRSDAIGDVYDYDKAINAVNTVIAAGHVNLLETLAERICEACLEDPCVSFVRVRVEKPAVLENCRGVGIEIARGVPLL